MVFMHLYITFFIVQFEVFLLAFIFVKLFYIICTKLHFATRKINKGIDLDIILRRVCMNMDDKVKCIKFYGNKVKLPQMKEGRVRKFSDSSRILRVQLEPSELGYNALDITFGKIF